MQQMDAQRSQVRGYILELGPDGSVQEIPTTSSAPFENYLPWTTEHLFDQTLVSAAGLFDDGGDLPASGHRRSGKRGRDAAATEEAILGLKRVLGVHRSGEECAVCLQGFRADETLRAMPCSHAFHRHCISTWLRRNAVCPLCRHHLVPDEEDEDREERATRRN